MKWVQTQSKAKLVWDGDERPEIADGAIRRLKVFQKNNYFQCINCGTESVCPIKSTACEDCLHDEEYKEKTKEIKEVTIRTKGYKEAVGFGHDPKTGKPLAIDRNGRKFNPKDSVYAKTGFEKDPHGWRVTGKKVTDPDYGKHER